jgi:hypothetical protein
MRTATLGTSRLWNGPRRSRRCLNDGNVPSRSKNGHVRIRESLEHLEAVRGDEGRMLVNPIELSVQHMGVLGCCSWPSW